jgi:hypothetical protein
MKQTLLTAFAMLLVLFTQCKKDEDNTPANTTTKSKTELLTNNSYKDWVLTSTLLNGNQVLQVCETDNTYSFYSDGRFVLDFGLNKCSSSETKNENRTWLFIDNETKMRWITPKDSFDLSIDSLTTDKLKVTQNTTYMGNPLQFILTFKAK